jgi:hypothetical protein
MRQGALSYGEIADEVIVEMSQEERLYLNQLMDEPGPEYKLLVEALWQEGCKFPRQQAALMLRNSPWSCPIAHPSISKATGLGRMKSPQMNTEGAERIRTAVGGLSALGNANRAKRNWWVGLKCVLCNTRVYADNGQFSQVYEGSVARDTARHWPGDCEVA